MNVYFVGQLWRRFQSIPFSPFCLSVFSGGPVVSGPNPRPSMPSVAYSSTSLQASRNLGVGRSRRFVGRSLK